MFVPLQTPILCARAHPPPPATPTPKKIQINSVASSLREGMMLGRLFLGVEQDLVNYYIELVKSVPQIINSPSHPVHV